MVDARGENTVTSEPRSRCSFSCAFSRLSRIWSSLIFSEARDGVCVGSFSAATCASRKSVSDWGAVV